MKWGAAGSPFCHLSSMPLLRACETMPMAARGSRWSVERNSFRSSGAKKNGMNSVLPPPARLPDCFTASQPSGQHIPIRPRGKKIARRTMAFGERQRGNDVRVRSGRLGQRLGQDVEPQTSAAGPRGARTLKLNKDAVHGKLHTAQRERSQQRLCSRLCDFPSRPRSIPPPDTGTFHRSRPTPPFPPHGSSFFPPWPDFMSLGPEPSDITE